MEARPPTVEIQFREVKVDDQTAVGSAWACPPSPGHQTRALLLAHGAGAGMDHEFLCYFHESLASKGLLTVKFNFPYIEKGRKIPDSSVRLEETFSRVLKDLESAGAFQRPTFIGGKSMGGRIATHLAAGNADVGGVILFGYPLHPPGREDKLRVSHFRHIQSPCLFLQGTRDPFCNLTLLKKHVSEIAAPVDLHIIEDADHSFHVRKSTGRTDQEVREEMSQVLFDWISRIGGKREGPSCE